MLNSLRAILLGLLSLSIIGCGEMSEGLTDMAEITEAINDASQCSVSRSEHKNRNGSESGLVEIKDCDVPDAIAEADRLNQKLLAEVPPYKKLDAFTFVFINGGVRQTIEYKDGRRDE